MLAFDGVLMLVAAAHVQELTLLAVLALAAGHKVAAHISFRPAMHLPPHSIAHSAQRVVGLGPPKLAKGFNWNIG